MPQPQQRAPDAPAPAIDLDTEIPAILAAAAAEAARLAPAICVELARSHVLMMRLVTAAKASFDRIEAGRPSQPAVCGPVVVPAASPSPQARRWTVCAWPRWRCSAWT
jgi:hypothetical protein